MSAPAITTRPANNYTITPFPGLDGKLKVAVSATATLSVASFLNRAQMGSAAVVHSHSGGLTAKCPLHVGAVVRPDKRYTTTSPRTSPTLLLPLLTHASAVGGLTSDVGLGNK